MNEADTGSNSNSGSEHLALIKTSPPIQRHFPTPSTLSSASLPPYLLLSVSCVLWPRLRVDLSAEEYGAFGCCVDFGDSSMSEFWRGLESDHQLHQVSGIGLWVRTN